jgi:hypothetical protein
MTPFTEAELLANSAAYFAELMNSGRCGAAHPRVCHHFWPLDDAMEDAYLPLLPNALAELDPDALIDVIGDPVGVELWQLLEPDEARIADQIRDFHATAVRFGAVYGGWSYEPRQP